VVHLQHRLREAEEQARHMADHREELERERKRLNQEEEERRIWKEREAVKLQRSKEIDDANKKISELHESI